MHEQWGLTGQDEYWDSLAAEMLGKYRAITLGYLRNYNDPIYSTVEEQGKVLQSGLALTPMAWAHTRNTVDWAIAWALIGEWASKELFPPPLHGNWPKHGHDGNLQEAYKQRRPCLVGWARAAFEQGSLPALLSLPGAVETRALPGDSFFQATHILMDYMRPAVVHGYGGAKVDLPVSLPALAKFGWTTLGASLLGTCSCLPQWCKKDSGDSVRLAPGCDVSFKVAPAPLTISEEVYLMGLWRHLTPAEAAHPSPARDWLARCNPNLSPDQAYFFKFANAWSASHRDHPAIKRAICQMQTPKLEKLVFIRFQGLHPPWVKVADWEFLMPNFFGSRRGKAESRKEELWCQLKGSHQSVL